MHLQKDLMEVLADEAHEIWADWEQWRAELCAGADDEIIKTVTDNWERQRKTRYSDLSEREKESDRQIVRRYLSVLDRAGFAIVPYHQKTSRADAEKRPHFATRTPITIPTSSPAPAPTPRQIHRLRRDRRLAAS